MAQKYTEAQALDPNTPGDVLQQIALDEPSLRPAIARNPATYQGLLDWLADLKDPEVDAALAARGVASEDAATAEELTLDSSQAVPEPVADAELDADAGAEPAQTPSFPAPPATALPSQATPVPAPPAPEAIGEPAGASATGPMAPGAPGGPPTGLGAPATAEGGEAGGGKRKRWLWIGIATAVVVALAGGGIAFAATRGGKPSTAATTSNSPATPSGTSTPTQSGTPSQTPTPTPTPTVDPVTVVEPALVLPEGVTNLEHSGNLLLQSVDPDSDSSRGIDAYVWTDANPGKVTAIPYRAPDAPDEMKWSTLVGSEDAEPYVLRLYGTRTPSEGLTPEKFHWYADRIDATSGEVTSSVPVDLSDDDFSNADVWAVGDRAFVQLRYGSKFAIDLTSGQKLGIPTGEIRGVTAQAVLMKSSDASFALNPATLKVAWTLSDDGVEKATGAWSVDGPNLAGDAMVSYGAGVGVLGSGAFEPAGPKKATDAYVDLASDGLLARYESDGKINGWYMLTPTELNFNNRFITTHLANDLDLEVYSVYDGVVYVKTTDQVLSVQLDGTVLPWGPWQWIPQYKIGQWTVVTSSPDYSNDGERSVLVKNFTKEMLTDSLVADSVEGPSGAPYDDYSSPSESPTESDY